MHGNVHAHTSWKEKGALKRMNGIAGEKMEKG